MQHNLLVGHSPALYALRDRHDFVLGEKMVATPFLLGRSVSVFSLVLQIYLTPRCVQSANKKRTRTEGMKNDDGNFQTYHEA